MKLAPVDRTGVDLNDPARCDAEGHCITCSDEGVPLRVVAVSPATGLAVCEDAAGRHTEVLIGVVDDVVPGDIVLVHAGAALARIEGQVALGGVAVSGAQENGAQENGADEIGAQVIVGPVVIPVATEVSP